VYDPEFYHLKLIPKEKKFDIILIRLLVSRETFDLIEIITSNSYGDETLIRLSDYDFNADPDDSKFTFTLTPGVDVLKLEE
jgi:outer membrane lipoprotein-sorting protein